MEHGRKQYIDQLIKEKDNGRVKELQINSTLI